jgi:hypothetical protein
MLRDERERRDRDRFQHGAKEAAAVLLDLAGDW